MARPLFQIVAILLLSTMAAATVMVCGFSLAAAPVAGCHHNRIPLHPDPAGHRCCGSDHRAVLATVTFSPRSALAGLRLPAAVDSFVLTNDSDMPQVASAPSGGPPSFILRI